MSYYKKRFGRMGFIFEFRPSYKHFGLGLGVMYLGGFNAHGLHIDGFWSIDINLLVAVFSIHITDKR